MDRCETSSTTLKVPALDEEGQVMTDTASGNVPAMDLFAILVEREIDHHEITEHSRSCEIDATSGINVTTDFLQLLFKSHDATVLRKLKCKIVMLCGGKLRADNVSESNDVVEQTMKKIKEQMQSLRSTIEDMLSEILVDYDGMELTIHSSEHMSRPLL